MLKSIKVYTPAKINLSLKVIQKLEDGYHEIETLFLAIGLCDILKIQLENQNKIFLQITDSSIPSDDTNLCHKAAKLFFKKNNRISGCKIFLEKRIPVSAGLGGGSSDAAATLLTLNQLCDFPLTIKELHEISFNLGADVPFFLKPGLAIGTGKGEILNYLNLDWDFWILLLFPDCKISTQWAYSNLKIGLTKEKKNIILKSLDWKYVQLNVFSEFFENDFESLVFSSYPNVGKLKQRLYDEGAIFASLSGTGSTVYGIFFTKKAAEIAQDKFKHDIKTIITKPIITHSV